MAPDLIDLMRYTAQHFDTQLEGFGAGAHAKSIIVRRPITH